MKTDNPLPKKPGRLARALGLLADLAMDALERRRAKKDHRLPALRRPRAGELNLARPDHEWNQKGLPDIGLLDGESE